MHPLTFTRCAFTIRIEQPGSLPPWKGSLLRGILGWGLTEVAAGAPALDWPGCRGPFAACLLDPQAAWTTPQAQVPWALQCDDRTTAMAPGSTLNGHLVLAGPWPGWGIELLHEALDAGVRRGLGMNRLAACLAAWDATPLDLPDTPPPTHIRLILRTPGRFKDRGQDLAHLHPPAIARGLVRRWRHLVLQSTGTDPLDATQAQALSAAADALVRLDGEDHPVTLERRSNRQDRSHPMDAVGGWCDIGGPALPTLWPWLTLAPWLHVGRQPCFGLGWADWVKR